MDLPKNEMKINLAIVSTSLNMYSETFIQAHKYIPGTNVRFYYGDPLPTMLEGKGALEKNILISALMHYLGKALGYPFKDRRENTLSRSLRTEKIECVLAEYGTTGAKILNVCKKNGIPLLVHFHGYDASLGYILEQYKIAYKDMFSYASAVFVVSKVMQIKIEALGCPPEKIYYTPYGPHDKFLDIQPTLEKKAFISVGRFVDKKAHYYTILAFKEVLKAHPDAKLVIAGDGVLLNTCTNLVRNLKIEHAVSLPGVITQQKFLNHLKVVRAYVQHSITALDGDMEGMPVSIIEASAAGVPVISTRHAGIPDVIIDKKTGLLVDEHDVEGMSKQMLKVLENKVYAQELGERGKSFIAENFSLQKHLRAISQVIKDSLT